MENANQTTLSGAYIPLKKFKDTFFPGKPWDPQIDSRGEERRRLDRMALADDQSSVTSASVAISTIMQGKTKGDLFDAQEAEERKMLMEDQIRKNQLAAERGDNLLDDFEKASEVS